MKRLLAIFFALFFLLCFSTPVLAATVFKQGSFYYNSWSPDWGLRVHGFTIEYWGDQFESQEGGQTYQAVREQDFFMWRSYSQYPVYSPEIGNGTGRFNKAELQRSGSTVQTQTSWNTGNYRSFLIDSRSIVFCRKKNALIQAFPGGSYRIKVTGTHQLPADEWFPPSSTKSVTTSYF